jgi:hypothetical protein
MISQMMVSVLERKALGYFRRRPAGVVARVCKRCSKAAAPPHVGMVIGVTSN